MGVNVVLDTGNRLDGQQQEAIVGQNTWDGAIDVHRSPAIPSSNFVQQLYREEEDDHNQGTIKCPTSYLKMFGFFHSQYSLSNSESYI